MRTLHLSGPRPYRRPRAAIGVMTLGIIILLTATSMAIFATVDTALTASQTSRDFLRARENLDVATADATARLNATAAVNSGAGHSADHRTDRPSTWSWSRSYHEAGNLDAGGQVHTQGVFNSTEQSRERAWRRRVVASQLNTTGEPTYGVVPTSAWLATVSSEDDSWVRGHVQGDWHAYGVGKVTVPGGSSVERILSYDDEATYEGRPGSFRRSTLSATLDERLLNQRVAGCGTQLSRFVASRDGQRLYAGQLSCYYSILIDAPTTVIGSGVASVVSYGDIVIADNLTNQAGNELHLYTDSGTVKFRNGPRVTAYVFAPNALCKTYSTTTVRFTGSLACRQIEMHAEFGQAPAPRPETAWPGETTTPVTFLEGPGYVDRFGD